eukprot:Rmarinus@m.877
MRRLRESFRRNTDEEHHGDDDSLADDASHFTTESGSRFNFRDVWRQQNQARRMSIMDRFRSTTRKTSAMARPDAAVVGESMKSKLFEGQTNEEYTYDEVIMDLPDVVRGREDFDAVLEVLRSLPDPLDDDFLQELEQKRDRQLDTLNKHLSSKMQSSYEELEHGMDRVQQVERDIRLALEECAEGRRALGVANDDLLKSGMSVLTKLTRQELIRGTQKLLVDVRAFIKLRDDLADAMDNNDLPHAVDCCGQRRDIWPKVSEVRGLQAVNDEIEAFEDNVQLRLKDSLKTICRRFTPVEYEGVLRSFALLHKMDVLGRNVVEKYEEAVEQLASEVLVAHVAMHSTNQVDPEILISMPYGELCGRVHADQYVSCTLRLLQVFTDLMVSHYRMRRWHEYSMPAHFEEGKEVILKLLDQSRVRVWLSIAQRCAVFLSCCRILGMKGERFLKTFAAINKFISIGREFSGQDGCDDLLAAIRRQALLYYDNFHRENMDLLTTMLENESWQRTPVPKTFTVDDTMGLVGGTVQVDFLDDELDTLANTVKKRGQDARGNSRGSLNNGAAVSQLAQLDRLGCPIFQQGSEYSNHADAADHTYEESGLAEELSQPMAPDFAALAAAAASESPTTAGHEGDSTSGEPDSEGGRPANAGAATITGKGEGTRNSSDDDGPGVHETADWIYTITSKNLLRFVGNYLRMMRVVNPLAPKACRGIFQFFEYYMYTVFNYFGTDGHLAGKDTEGAKKKRDDFFLSKRRLTITEVEEKKTDTSYGEHLGALLNRLSGTYKPVELGPDGEPERTLPPGVVALPSISVKISATGNMFGVVERTVATESVVALSAAFARVKPVLVDLLQQAIAAEAAGGFSENQPSAERVGERKKSMWKRTHSPVVPQASHPVDVDDVDMFYQEIMVAVNDMRRYTYRHLGKYLFDMDPVANHVAQVKWDVKDIPLEANPYIHSMLKDFQMLQKLLDALTQSRCMPLDVKDMLWEIIIGNTMEHLVEGYSRAKKCTNEGRAMMAMDLRYLQMGLEKMTRVRPLPKKDLVDAYIRGYYLRESDFLEFVSSHKDQYTAQQLIKLAELGVCQNMKRKQRQEFLQKIQDMKGSE